MSAKFILFFIIFSAFSFTIHALEASQETTDYRQLLTEYEAILQKGEFSYELYFNLGVAYGKLKQPAKSRLFFEKARKIRPNNKKLLSNIKVIESRVAQPEIEPLPTFFLTSISQYAAGILSLNGWFSLVILSFLVLCLSVYFQYFSTNRVAGYVWFISTFLLLVGLSCFGIRQTMLNDNKAAVVMKRGEIKSSPEEVTEPFLTIKAGQKIQVIEQVGDWYLVRLANGLEGYIQVDLVERV